MTSAICVPFLNAMDDTLVVINMAGDTISPPRGASDAFLAPYHVERGMMYALRRFKD